MNFSKITLPGYNSLKNISQAAKIRIKKVHFNKVHYKQVFLYFFLITF